jgi:glyoxylase-like metal-dependent hydrolase (beta-lactamase superfamily II)
MKIDIIHSDTNSIIVHDSKNIYAFDPFYPSMDWKHKGMTAALTTHGHFDHIAALADTKIPWFMNHHDLPVLDWSNNFLPSPVETKPSDLADAPAIGDMKIIETPGHSAGSVCFYFPGNKILLSGDTLFFDSVGRTDLPTGNQNQLTESIAKLKNYGFPDDTLVIPGHGRFGYWNEILRANPFLMPFSGK